VDVGGLAESWRFEPNTIVYLRPYAPPDMQRLDDVRTLPGTPIGAEAIGRLLRAAERTDQGARDF
jgi:hypothetical protein